MATDFPESVKGYKLGKQLGSGANGKVYLGTRGSEQVAIKYLGENRRAARKEAKAKYLKNPNLCQVLDFDEDSNCIILEYIDGRSIQDYVAKQERFSFQRLLEISLGIANAIEYLHQNQAVHRDIKPDNIMIDKMGNVKVIDYGTLLFLEGSTSGKLQGTPHYMAPEVMTTGEADQSSDCFSYGATLYQLCTGQLVYRSKGDPSKEDIQVIENYLRSITYPDQIDKNLSKTFSQLLLDLLSFEKSKRPEMTNVKVRIIEENKAIATIDFDPSTKRPKKKLSELLSGLRRRFLVPIAFFFGIAASLFGVAFAYIVLLQYYHVVEKDRFEVVSKGEFHMIKKGELYKMSALVDSVRTDLVFQDFSDEDTAKGKYNPVSWLWADAFYGGKIEALVEKSKIDADSNDPKNYLVIKFANKGRWPANVAVRSMTDAAWGPGTVKHFSFKAKVGIDSADKGIDLFIRFVDRNHTHWKYGEERHNYKDITVRGNQWKEYVVRLDKVWRIFPGDGNVMWPGGKGGATPDFSVITSIVIVPVREGTGDTVNESEGEIHMADFRALAKQ